jgi:SH3-like domain-containing protein
MIIDVIQPYTSQYPDPICFDAGAPVEIEREDPEHPGWFWCRVSSGKEGWVHRSFLGASAGITKSVSAYSAKELTVSGGEQGTVIRSMDGWSFVRLHGGEEGWLPSSSVRPVVV